MDFLQSNFKIIKFMHTKAFNIAIPRNHNFKILSGNFKNIHYFLLLNYMSSSNVNSLLKQPYIATYLRFSSYWVSSKDPCKLTLSNSYPTALNRISSHPKYVRKISKLLPISFHLLLIQVPLKMFLNINTTMNLTIQ